MPEARFPPPKLEGPSQNLKSRGGYLGPRKKLAVSASTSANRLSTKSPLCLTYLTSTRGETRDRWCHSQPTAQRLCTRNPGGGRLFSTNARRYRRRQYTAILQSSIPAAKHRPSYGPFSLDKVSHYGTGQQDDSAACMLTANRETGWHRYANGERPQL